ncbi:phage tail tube protein [Candidatus Haliotispira prima]|uniref:Phage tail tube protein n=1 Tax=Candidatus Haliotispira prima TaxID=3034016 RepID=A0ABY8MHT1_9SPIO|nr:phage tail tube protein [Candidatus Haliotispira prima]
MAKRRLKEIEKINITGLGFIPLKQDSAEFTPEYQKRTTVKGQLPEYDGYKVQRNSASLKFNLNDRAGESWQRRVNETTEAEVTVYYSDGTGVVMHDAYCMDVGSTKTGEISGFVFESSTSDDF